MNKLTYILSFLVLILSVWVIILWMEPSATDKNVASEARYGVIEGLQLVEQTMLNGGKHYFVEDAKGDIIFRVPLSGCLLDTHFRNGKLRFREMATGREGYIDKSGNISFLSTAEHVSQHEMATQEGKVARVAYIICLRLAIMVDINLFFTKSVRLSNQLEVFQTVLILAYYMVLVKYFLVFS